MFKKDRVDQLDRSIANNQGGEENATYNKKKEVYVDWSHLA